MDTKQIDTRVPQKCKNCALRPWRCPAFTSGMPCSSPLSMSPPCYSEDKDILELVPNVSGTHILYPPQLSSSEEEADQEVAQICKTPVYYHLPSLTSHHHQYYIYNCLDRSNIDEQIHERRHRFSLEEAVLVIEH